MADVVAQLRGFMKLIESQLDVTEPTVLDDNCSVVCLAPTDKGLVGLDADTGSPVRVGWKYKSIHEKPVIIHAGKEQTVIPPRPAPVSKKAELSLMGRPRPPRARQRIVDT